MPYRLTNIRALVIDENPAMRMLMRGLLLDLGFGMIDMANEPEQGWETFLQFNHDLIFLDWPAKNTASLDFIRLVRDNPNSPQPHVPIVVVTGYSEAERVRQARDAGATDLIAKPFTINNLVNHMIHIIESQRAFVRAPQFVGPDRRRRTLDTENDRRNEQDLLSMPQSYS